MNVIAPRPAATVVVIREAHPFEILMVRRHDNIKFMGGSYVFPGGRVDEGDRATGIAPLPPSRFPDLSGEQDLTHRAAAVRELHEEANVTVATGDLEPFAHWVTPEIENRRYDTRFYLARMPGGQEAKHDESETTALDWLSPEEAIARFERHEILLPPPTWTTIRQLQKMGSIEAAFEWARSRQIVRVVPGYLKDANGVMLTLPGDPLLPPIPGWDVPEETRFVLQPGARWQPLRP
jgi:8-oxo-dGTP pyrophosphatase MutT (NUDIX family)